MADATSTTGPVVRGWTQMAGPPSHRWDPRTANGAEPQRRRGGVAWPRSTDAVGVGTVTPRPNIGPLGARGRCQHPQAADRRSQHWVL